MAGLLFVYSRSSIAAAKRNAARHRAADGGQISWQNESLRQRGALERPKDPSPFSVLFGGAKGKASDTVGRSRPITAVEEALMKQKAKSKRDTKP